MFIVEYPIQSNGPPTNICNPCSRLLCMNGVSTSVIYYRYPIDMHGCSKHL